MTRSTIFFATLAVSLLLCGIAYASDNQDDDFDDFSSSRIARDGHFGRYRNIHNRRPVPPRRYQPHPHNANRRIYPAPSQTGNSRPQQDRYVDEADRNGYAAILGR
ncbi:hypothetical protein Fcan01_27994 [Folsomia candida]|uniref:Secreted protein n=1 Tax=Folsomia candida TaxID=158441 RepID=A0A226CV01_FOLCA|nr:hypothetical protein Fcan01_27994 [Folsomia candida]